jgi:hypothetical protein
MKHMSCRKHGHDDDSCVCAILRRIADVQDEVKPEDVDCKVSCARSIDELLEGTSTAPINAKNTIPLILYCDCAPFQGFGVKRNSNTNKFECIPTFFFRVSSVDDDCCATLELLEPSEDAPSAALKTHVPMKDDPCEQLGANTKSFIRTGICITMDLSCFCGVSCLEAVFAARA